MAEYVRIGADGSEEPARTWWDMMHPRLKLVGIIEGYNLVGPSGLLQILMPQVVAELEKAGCQDILDCLVNEGVIIKTYQGEQK